MKNKPVVVGPKADASDASTVKKIAVLDDNNRLIGSKVVGADVEGVDFGDLPLNGSYKYDREHQSFIPLGHGFPKVKVSQPYSVEFVLSLVIEALGNSAPNEAVEWKAWFDQNLRQREEETQAVRRKG